MVKGQWQIFPSGPPVVRRAIGEILDKEALGGAQMRVHESGQVDNEAESEEDAFEQIRQFLSYLPGMKLAGGVVAKVEVEVPLILVSQQGVILVKTYANDLVKRYSVRLFSCHPPGEEKHEG